jgi:hypothetical protein
MGTFLPTDAVAQAGGTWLADASRQVADTGTPCADPDL